MMNLRNIVGCVCFTVLGFVLTLSNIYSQDKKYQASESKKNQISKDISQRLERGLDLPVIESVAVTELKSRLVASSQNEVGVVANADDRTIHIIDVASNSIAGPFLSNQLGTSGVLLDVAITSDGATALVSNFQQRDVFVIDLSNPFAPQVVTSIDVGFAAEDIALAPSDNYALVTDGGRSTQIAVIDLSSNSLVVSTDLDPREAQGVAVAPDGQNVLVVDYNNGLVHTLLLDPNTGQISDSPSGTIDVGGNPTNIVVSPLGNIALVANSASGDKIDILRINGIGQIAFDDSLNNISNPQSVVFTQDGTAAYVLATGFSPDRIIELDVTTSGNVSLSGRETNVVTDAAGWYFGVDVLAISNNSDRIYAGNPSDSLSTDVAVVDRQTMQLNSVLAAGNFPTGIAMSGSGAVVGGLNLTYNQIDASNFPSIESFVTVTGDQGNPVSGLTESNFQVREDGQLESPISVTQLGGGTEPISVAFVIDRSGSMGGQPLQDAKTAAIEFVNRMTNNDRGAVISFSSSVRLDQSFTNDRNLLIDAINSLASGGQTAIYDAAIRAVDETNTQSGRKAILLLSDGADNESSASLQDAIDAAVQSNVPIFTIGLGLSQGSSAEQDMMQLANATGGQYYFAPNSSDLQQIYNLISQQLQNQYRLTYTTHNPSRDGSTRTVEVTVTNQGQSDVKSRTYVAPQGGGAPIFPSASTTQTVGNEFWVDINVGRSGAPVNNLFGLSFELNYTQTSFVDVVTPHSSNVVPGNFLGNDVVFFQTVDESAGTVSVGISRKSGQGGVDGNGTVVRIKFIARTNTPDGTQIRLTLTDVTANDPNDSPIVLNPSDLTIRFDSFAVWPGDTDNNGLVNQADVLPIGLYWNQTGPSRSTQGCGWGAQGAQSWNNMSATYADANGDGVVDQADVLCIGLNWNRTHTTTIFAETNSGINLTGAANLQILFSGQPDPGKDFFIDVYVNDAVDLFGLAFELEYSPTMFIDPLEATEGSNNLLGNDVIFFPNIEQTEGKISIGITRKAGQGGVDGSGLVARIQARMSSSSTSGEDTTWLSLRNVQANDPDGNPIDFDTTNVSLVPLITDIEQASNRIPDEYALHQNYPNPFNPETKIQYDLPKSIQVRIEIFNLLGQRIRTLVDERKTAGSHAVIWNGRKQNGEMASSGVYIYRLTTEGMTKSKKLLLLQ